MAFYIDQKVIRRRDHQPLMPELWPPLDQVLTISWIGRLPWWTERDLMLDFVEFPGPPTREYWRGFKACYFEPIVKHHADISVFTALLAPATHRNLENV